MLLSQGCLVSRHWGRQNCRTTSLRWFWDSRRSSVPSLIDSKPHQCFLKGFFSKSTTTTTSLQPVLLDRSRTQTFERTGHRKEDCSVKKRPSGHISSTNSDRYLPLSTLWLLHLWYKISRVWSETYKPNSYTKYWVQLMTMDHHVTTVLLFILFLKKYTLNCSKTFLL